MPVHAPRVSMAVASSETANKPSSIARFFSASPESLWMSIVETQPAIVADAQTLFDQITTTRQTPLRSTSLHREHAPQDEKKDKLWAVVAVAATAIAHDLTLERQHQAANGNGEKRQRATAGRKRKMRESESEDASSFEEDDDLDEDDDHAAHGRDRDRARRERAKWHLVDFLVEANVTMSAFLEGLTSLFDRLLLDPELLQVATLLKEEFTIASVLFEKYRFMWKKFALQTNEGSSSEPPHERTELLLRLGWLLFLIMRRRFSDVYAGLGNLYYLLLAVLKLSIGQVHVKTRSLEAEVAAALSALSAKPMHSHSHSQSNAHANGMDEQRLLDMLCSSPKVDADEVMKAYAHVAAVAHELVRSETLVMAETLETTANNENYDANGFAAVASGTVTGICANAMLRQNTTRLFELYASEYLTSCGSFDERVYLNEQSRQSLLGPRPLPAHSVNGGEGSNGESSHGVPPPSMALGRSDPRTPSSSTLSSPVRRPTTPGQRDVSSTPSSGSSGAPPPSPFTVQAWQWHGSSPPPSLPRGLSTPITRTLGGGVQQSPFVTQTPVTAAVEISSWIRDTVVATGDGSAVAFVSPPLRSFFQACASDPTDRIADVLSEMSQKMLSSRRRAAGAVSVAASGASLLSVAVANGSASSEVDGSLKKTTNLSIALFYRVLEALLVSERDRLKTSNFSSLLNNETFLSSLFACSLEVGLKAHSLITLSFPFLLDVVGVNAFDFGKVIESFVKHVPRLPTTLKRHMRDLEQVILDSLAWRADSRLYVVLKGERQASPHSAQPPSTAEASDATEQPQQQQTPSTSTTTTTTTTAPRATVLQLFFRKVLSLAATRIFRLGSMLDLDAAYMNQVWSAIKECMSSQVHLLKDRHLDQIILCSIYGVCKVNKLANVTFNRIIEQYKKLQNPPTSGAFQSTSLARKTSDIIRDIKLDDQTTRGDVIKFYNRCYIPAMKVFLLQYQAQDKQVAAANAAVATASGTAGVNGGSRDGHLVTASTSDSEIVAEAAASAVEKVMQTYAPPPPPRTPLRGRTAPPPRSPSVFGSPPSRTLPMFTSAEVESLPVSVHQSSPKRVLASNIYMSPLQNARYQTQRSNMTPRSHALYAFGESPSRDLALINRAVNNSTTTSSMAARTAGPPLLVVSGGDSDDTSGSNSNHTTPRNKRRRT